MRDGGHLDFQANSQITVNGEAVAAPSLTIGNILGSIAVLLGILVALFELYHKFRPRRD